MEMTLQDVEEMEYHSRGQMMRRFIWWKLKYETGRWCSQIGNPSKAIWVKEY